MLTLNTCNHYMRKKREHFRPSFHMLTEERGRGKDEGTDGGGGGGFFDSRYSKFLHRLWACVKQRSAAEIHNESNHFHELT